MLRPASCTLALFVLVSAVTACDSTDPEPDSMADIEQDDVETIEEMIVGLWFKDADGDEFDWLFKEGGSYLAGPPTSVFPISGRWSLDGDTLAIRDNACFDAVARYHVAISPTTRNDLVTTPIFDDCSGRSELLGGVWRRFIYAENR